MASKLKAMDNSDKDFDVNKANCAQLRQHLRQHGLPVSGSKKELIERVNGSFEIGKQPLEVLRLNDENLATERARSRLLTPLGEKLPEVKSITSGWSSDVNLIPYFSDNDLYNYLVLNNQRTYDGKPIGAKRQLKAKVFYSDGHVHSVMFHEINRTIMHCYVKACVIPSIPTQKENKKDYCTWACLSKVTGNVHAAGCDCEAGEGEACNHIAALMYGLIDITEKKKEGTNASTSKQCLWNQPRSRKLSPKKASELIFKKQKFNDKNNNTIVPNVRTSSCADSPSKSVEPVDILRFGNKLKQCYPHAGFLLTHEHTIDKFKQPSNRAKENLGLPEPPFMFRDCVDMSSENCQKEFDNYFEKLSVTSEEAEQIQMKTEKQLKSLNWFEARKDRLTSSNFGQIVSRKELQASKSLMKSVLGYTSFTSESVRWGISHEPAARRFYLKDLKECHPGLTVSECGFVVSPKYPHLGASPDGLVSCSHCEEKNGLLEIKCPYKYRNVTPEMAAKDKDFCCYLENGVIRLKKSHIYYCQVQGQMAVCNRKWCDFYIWTLMGRSVERNEFDKEKWETMEKRLTLFFKVNIIPEIFSRRIQRGVQTDE